MKTQFYDKDRRLQEVIDLASRDKLLSSEIGRDMVDIAVAGRALRMHLGSDNLQRVLRTHGITFGDLLRDVAGDNKILRLSNTQYQRALRKVDIDDVRYQLQQSYNPCSRMTDYNVMVRIDKDKMPQNMRSILRSIQRHRHETSRSLFDRALKLVDNDITDYFRAKSTYTKEKDIFLSFLDDVIGRLLCTIDDEFNVYWHDKVLVMRLQERYGLRSRNLQRSI